MLKRKKPLKRGGRLRPATKKRAGELREYSQRRKVFLGNNPKCKQCGCYASEVHHSQGRVQHMLNVEEHWIALCHTCHMKAHHDRRWAVENGLMPKPLWMISEDARND
jgi:5-methylcytosine-specific restriction endonuclease McrA